MAPPPLNSVRIDDWHRNYPGPPPSENVSGFSPQRSSIRRPDAPSRENVSFTLSEGLSRSRSKEDIRGEPVAGVSTGMRDITPRPTGLC